MGDVRSQRADQENQVEQSHEQEEESYVSSVLSNRFPLPKGVNVPKLAVKPSLVSPVWGSLGFVAYAP
jgi:hypothetical protein